MTRLSNIKKYISTLKEIDDIMGAMKNLAFIEINKLNNYLKSQNKMQQTILDMGGELLTFFLEEPLGLSGMDPDVVILIGSERGFCGNFNDIVRSEWKNNYSNKNAKLIVVGEKLAERLENDADIDQVIVAPGVAEEIPSVISVLLDSLKKLLNQEQIYPIAGNWDVVYNEYSRENIETKSFNFLKQFYKINRLDAYPYETDLYVSAEEFFVDYLEHYLFTNLYTVFYHSFICENEKRLRHLESAKSRLEKKCEELTIKSNILRQEEITEEIENILLGVNLPN